MSTKNSLPKFLGSSKKEDVGVFQEQLTGDILDTAPNLETVYKEKTGKTVSSKDSYKSNGLFQTDRKKGGLRESIQQEKKSRRFNIDIVITSIAIALLLGAVLFYFQGVQPLFLDRYTTQTNQQIDDLSKRYVDQVKSLERLQNSLATSTSYNTYISCTENTMYDQLEQDSRMVDTSSIMMSPDQNYKENEKYNGMIYQTDVKDVYNRFYNDYSNNISQISMIHRDLKHLPRFLEYRNMWIQTCQDIKLHDGNIAKITQSCNNLVQKTEEYRAGSVITKWSDVESFADKTITQCKALGTIKDDVNYASWELDWIDNYNQMMSYQIDFEENIEKMNTLQDTMKESAQQAKFDVNKIYNDKIKLANIWYILNF